ncbi:MAG: NAD-dependent epimerase/dehydratase family protein [Methanomassiliicoccales archaeon]|nr:MAG: NAD-dependent epimerase/dehydratase family protein [Methanomassiliicoccales archaeon]
MKVLVTGASGFLGRYVVDELLREGHDVFGGVRATSNISHLKEKGVGLVPFDLVDKDIMSSAVKGMDAVIHLAAYYTFSGKKELYQRLNVDATKELARLCLENGISRLVYCSSTEAMGPVDGIADETAPLRPVYEYGRSKAMAEAALSELASKGLDHVVLRPSGIYGPHNVDDVSYWFITSYGRRLATKFIIGTGKNRIQFVHVADVARAFSQALSSKAAKGRTYIISEGRSYTYEEVYAILGEITGIPPPRLHLPPLLAKVMIAPIQSFNSIIGRKDFMYRISTVDSVTCDRAYSIDRARKELGYEPRYDLRKGLRETYEWYVENGLIQ